MERGDDLAFPSVVAILHRFAQELILDELARPGDVPEIVERDGRDAKAFLMLHDDEAVGRQMHERFAQRAEADIVTLAQIVEAELVSGLEASGQDVFPQKLQHVGRECRRGDGRGLRRQQGHGSGQFRARSIHPG